MKKLIIIFPTLFFASCQNTQNQHGIVKIDDEKTEIIQRIFESVKKEDNSYLQSIFDENMIMINSSNDTLSRKEFFEGIELMCENFDNINFDGIVVGKKNDDAIGPGVETVYYKNGIVWTNIWSTFIAEGTKTGKKVNFPFHISYKWKNGKIIEEYQFFDTSAFDDEINAETEIVYFVYMRSNNKTANEIDDFSDYYQRRVDELEPDILGWTFFKSGDEQIILMERYQNEAAILNHINNISEGNPMEEDFKKFLDHYLVDSLQIYGQTSRNFKDIMESFPFKVSYNEMISGYSY